MSANIANNAPYLRTSREYPQDDLHQLSVELSKTYIDVAGAVNNRTISIFPTNRAAINGENWFISGQRQQGLRQVYTISAAGNTAHGLNIANISRFTRIYGTFTDGTSWYTLPYVDPTAANQISIIVDATNIVITAGGGAPPSITSGTVVLEWISNV